MTAAQLAVSLAVVVSGVSAQRVLFSTTESQLVRHLEPAGDLDLDGIPDLFATRHYENDVRMLSGRDGGLIAKVTIPGGILDMAVAGDLDRDGRTDFAVSDRSASGNAFAHSGATGALLHTWPGGAEHLAGIGDVDGDGHDDVAILRRTRPDTTEIYSGRTGVLLRSAVQPSTAGVLLGVAPAGDVDGDGRGDFFLRVSDGGGTTGDWVEVRNGATGAVLRSIHRAPTTTMHAAAIGDVNGDGRDDLALSVSGALGSGGFVEVYDVAGDRTLGTYSGVVAGGSCATFFGGPISSGGDVDADGALDFASYGVVFSGRDARFLLRVAPGSTPQMIGDVDDDGFCDLVGAFGLSYVFWSGATQRESWHLPLEGDPRVGPALEAAGIVGDVDGDGTADIGSVVLESPFLAASTDHRWRVLSGVDGTVIHEWTTSSTVQGITGFAPLDDLDGDGRAEFVCKQIDGAANELVLRRGSDHAVLWRQSNPDHSWALSLASGIDYNADGTPDVLVGTPRFAWPPHERTVEIRSGTDGAVLLELKSTVADDEYGAALAVLDDLDRDGAADFAIGAPGQWNTASRFEVRSGRTGALLYDFHETRNGMALGAALARVADLDGDGVDDLLAGAPEPNLAAGGSVLRFSGATGAPLGPLNPARPVRALGDAIATGDYDGDGQEDVVIGTSSWNASAIVIARDGSELDVFPGWSSNEIGKLVGFVASAAAGPRRVAIAARARGISCGGYVHAMGPVSDFSSFSSYGTACAGSAGRARLAWSGVPQPGLPFSIGVRGVAPGTPTALALGSSNRQWRGVALPLGLTAAGFTGCDLLAGIDLALPGVGAGYVLPLPPALADATVYLQNFHLDAVNPRGVVSSNGGRLRIRP